MTKRVQSALSSAVIWTSMRLLLCGGLLALIALTTAVPNGHATGCLPGNVSHSLPFCDPSLSVKARIKDLVARLTVDEKIGLMSADSGTKVSRQPNNCHTRCFIHCALPTAAT